MVLSHELSISLMLALGRCAGGSSTLTSAPKQQMRSSYCLQVVFKY